jgi:hypothetical protein
MSRPLGIHDSPEETRGKHDVLQGIIGSMVLRVPDEGADPAEVEVQLRRAIADAGLPEQPAPWMRAAAAEIAGGRVMIVDVQDQLTDDPVTTEVVESTAEQQSQQLQERITQDDHQIE